MKCLRCGYCCKNCVVAIVDDPKKDIKKNNFKIHEGNGIPCQHLKGEKPGEYSCAVHNKSWYKKTPCFSHGQIEDKINSVCRIGEYILQKCKIG